MENSENGHKNGVGRPFIQLDPVLLEDLAGIGCTMNEIASVCHCSVDTLERNYAEPIKRGRNELNMSLKRKQVALAKDGNPTMLIWLGKQYLNQRDKQELTGADGGPIKHEFDYGRLTDEQLSELESLVESASTGNTDSSER